MATRSGVKSPFSAFASAVTMAGGVPVPSSNTNVSSISTPTPVVEGAGALVYTVTLSAITTTPDTFLFTLAGTGLNPALPSMYDAPTFSNGVQNVGGYVVVPAGVTSFLVSVNTKIYGYYSTDRDLTLTLGGVSATGKIQGIAETVVLWSDAGFGLVGDGIADDSAALEAAFSSPMSINYDGGTFRIARAINPIRTLNAFGLSGRHFAPSSGTVWTTETRLKTFQAYDGSMKTISATCAKVQTEGTFKAKVLLDNRNHQFDKAAFNINAVVTSGGSLSGSFIGKYYIVPIIDGVDFQCMYQSYNHSPASGSKITLDWAAFSPLTGTVTGYKIYGRGGYLGSTAAAVRTFEDNGSITPTGTLPDTNSSGIFFGGKYYGAELKGFEFTVLWPTDSTRSQITRFGTGFYSYTHPTDSSKNDEFGFSYRMGISGWNADINGFLAEDCKFNFGDSLCGGSLPFITTGELHTGVSKAIRNVTLRKCIFNTNSASAFLDRSNVADVGYTEKTITDILVEDCIFQGQGQCNHTKPFIQPEFRIGISEDGTARTRGFKVQRCRFDDYVYAAFEMVWNLPAGYPDLDVGFEANNNIVTNTGWPSLGIGCGFTVNNARQPYAANNPRAYNINFHHNYFDKSALGEQFKFIRDSIIDSNIFERTGSTLTNGETPAQRIVEGVNWDNVTYTNNYMGDTFHTGNGNAFTMNLFDGNNVSGNRLDARGATILYSIDANNSIVDNVLNYDYSGSFTYFGILLAGYTPANTLNNTIRNKVYLLSTFTGALPVHDQPITSLPANIRDTSTVYLGGAAQTYTPKTTVAYTAALTDLSARNWHLADTFTLTGSPASAWECRLPGVIGNRTITNSSGQSCTISCYDSATTFTISAGQTKTVNVSASYAVTEVV